jgi:hypothetical protein
LKKGTRKELKRRPAKLKQWQKGSVQEKFIKGKKGIANKAKNG